MSNITTVSPLHQRMIEDMAARKLNPHTQRSHISSCKRFAAWLKRVKLAQLAQAGGLSVEALSRRATTHACGQGLLLGFTNIAEADALPTCRRLHQMIGKSLDNEAPKPAPQRLP